MTKVFLAFITFFVLLLFINGYQITKYPVSLSMDEVAKSLNAYSILKTGHDEHGAFMPLSFKSVGDYKPPVQIYLMVPFYAIFGVSEFSTRLPIVFLGSLTPIFFVLLLKKLKFSWPASFLGGVFLGISPWHVHFVRGNFEAAVALLFLVMGTYFFLWWVGAKKDTRLILSALFFSLSVWAYHAERLFVPLLALSLIFIYKKEFNLKKPKVKNGVVKSLVVLAIFVIPYLYLSVFTPAIRERAISTSIFRETSLIQSLHQGNYSNVSQKIFNNDTYLIVRHWAGKYLNYFDLRFWFFKGMQLTPPGYPGLGLFYFTDIIVFLFGVFALSFSKDKRLKYVAISWFFLGPVPASFTMNEQHPLRALTWLPFFGIIAAAGFEYLLKNFKKKYVILVYVVITLINLVYFADIYTKQFSRLYSEFWQYGYKQVALYACDNWDNYDKIVISDTFGSYGPLNTGLPYLYVDFYCPRDREMFITTGKHSKKLEFRRPNKEDVGKEGELLIGSPWDFLDFTDLESHVLKRVDFLNGKEAFLMVSAK